MEVVKSAWLVSSCLRGVAWLVRGRGGFAVRVVWRGEKSFLMAQDFRQDFSQILNPEG